MTISDLLPIQSINSVDVVDSRLIAQELEIQHKNFMTTIKKYKDEIQSTFGALAFQTDGLQGTSSYAEYCYLNEEQATYIMTLSKNTDKVRACKRKLVKSFSQAKKIIASQIKTPQTYLEALKALVASEEQKELLRLENQQLEKDNEVLATAVDELFNYSSILRVAKFNNVSETQFKWRTLKATSEQLGLEVKKVPSPRYANGMNLYPHDAWRVAYPDVALPETTTLRIYTHQSIN